MLLRNDDVALVTGAGSGIGRAAARAFAREGARVMASDVRAEAAEETVAALRREGADARSFPADVSDPAAVRRLIEETIRAFGRLDLAFNNAGIEGVSAPTIDCTEADWDRTLAVNLRGVWLCMKHELVRMRERRRGVIVNCSSIAGLVGFVGASAYVASKHGVVGLTRTAALEYAREGIRVNAVCPGVIRTAMVERVVANRPELAEQLVQGEPIGRMGTAEEVADVVVWLSSDRASFVTGQAIAVDGGWVAR